MWNTKIKYKNKLKVIRSLWWLSMTFILTACGSSEVKDAYAINPAPITIANSNTNLNNQPSTGTLVTKTNDSFTTNTTNTRNGHGIDRSSFSTRVPVLAYHHILTVAEKNSDKRWKNNGMVITVDQFASEMKYLHDHDYHVITLSQLESFINGQENVPYHSVVLTFDDGYESNFHYASPILRQYGYRATEFAIVSRIPNEPQPWTSTKLLHFSWPEIKSNADVFDIESHTYAMHYYRNGRAAMLVLPQNEVLYDLVKSKHLLHANYFAYPYGGHTGQSIGLLKLAGYRLAVITTRGYATKGCPIFEVPRFGIEPGLSIASFQAIVSGMYQIPKPKSSIAPSFSLTHLAKMQGMLQ